MVWPDSRRFRRRFVRDCSVSDASHLWIRASKPIGSAARYNARSGAAQNRTAPSSRLRTLPETDIHICAVTIGEIQAGIERARETDPAKAAEIESWLDKVEKNYSVLPIDARAFRAHARLMNRKSDAYFEDAMIAAVAQTNGLILATRNLKDFAAFGVKVVDPFTAQKA